MIEPAYLSVAHTAKYLDVSVSHVEHNWPAWVTQHKVRVYRQGRKVLFNRRDLDSMMEKNLVLQGVAQ